MKPASSELVGRRFGRLLVAECAGRKSGRVVWTCVCDCGNQIIARHNNLQSGNTTSCGCARIRHGRAKKSVRDKTYNSWQNMIARVEGQRGPEIAKNYSDRGIGVCHRWRSFDFFLMDMGPRPVGMTLDRIDNDRGYECGICESCVGAGRNKNCRWVTRKDQQRNRRANVLLTLNGENACLTEWAERIGVPRSTLVKRVNAWGAERALTTPVKRIGS